MRRRERSSRSTSAPGPPAPPTSARSRLRSPSTSISTRRARPRRPFHLELGFDGAAPAYKPGDSLDLHTENDSAYVDAVLKAAGLASDNALRAELTKSRDITTLSLKTLETYAASTGHQIREAAHRSGPGARLDRRTSARRPPGALRSACPPSSCAHSPDRLRRVPTRSRRRAVSRRRGDLLIFGGAIRDAWPRAQGRRLQHVAERSRQGRTPARQAQAEQAFRAGRYPIATSSWSARHGVAPFRAFLQEPPCDPRHGRNWLFFGDRQFHARLPLLSSNGRMR